MEDFKNISEIINNLSWLWILIVAIIGLRQLKISKDIASMNAKRDSLKLANEQVQHYMEIIKLINNLNKEIETKNIKFFDNTKVSIGLDTVKINEIASVEEIEKMNTISESLTYTLNELESLSVFFTSKLADEQIAFRAIWKSFCWIVKKLLPFISLVVTDWYYKNTLKLFFIRNKRLIKEGLEFDKKKVEAKLNEIKNEEFTPIWTE